jgi:hypothetical protein
MSFPESVVHEFLTEGQPEVAEADAGVSKQ